MNNLHNLYIFGTGVTAQSIFRFVLDYELFTIKGFVVDSNYKTTETYCGLPVYTMENLPLEFNKERDFFFIAMEWDKLNSIRKEIYLRFKSNGYKLANIISPNSINHGELKGDNCWISDYVVIENNAIVYNNVFIKTKATIAHLSTIESHCFVGANSFIAGGCMIGEQTYIGISSTIFNSVNIGKKCLVGACTYVKRHLPDFTVIKTKNEEFIIKQYSEHEIENKLLASIKIR